MSFEFLASAGEWEAACQHDASMVDQLPFKIAPSARWTLAGEILNTLAPFKKASGSNLASLAKDGAPRRMRNSNFVRGFPGIVETTSFSERTDANDQPTEASLWEQFSTPSLDLLDSLPKGCILVRLSVTLCSTWYSRDDRPFYPMDNALRRDAVFSVPFLSAAGLKGLVHWASFMVRHTRQEDENAVKHTCQDDENDQFLFGTATEGGEENENSVQGALYCYPVTWYGKLGLEVINAQNSKTGAGTGPVKYEVLQPGGKGTLHFLLTNLPNRPPLTFERVKAFLDALRYLLNEGFLSAKASAGWGRVKLSHANFAISGIGADQAVLSTVYASVQATQEKQAEEAWNVFLSPSGELLPLAGNEKIFTNKRLKALWNFSRSQLTNREACYAKIVSLYEARKGSSSRKDENVSKPLRAGWLIEGNGEQDYEKFSTHLLKAFKEKLDPA